VNAFLTSRLEAQWFLGVGVMMDSRVAVVDSNPGHATAGYFLT